MSTTIEIPPGESIDGYLRNNRNPGTTFVLGPGEYTTAGCFDFPEHDLCMLAPGCAIIGAGSLATFLIGDPTYTHEGVPTGYAEVLTGGARTTGFSDCMSVRGLTIQTDFSKVNIGLHLWTSRAWVSDVVIENLTGSRTSPFPVKEGFGILINNSAFPVVPDGGHLVENCEVHLDVRSDENYSTAIFVGCVARVTPMLRSKIARCRVVADDGHAGFAVNDRVVIEDCEVVGFRRAVFVDTGPVRDCHIRGLDASRVAWALDLRGTGERRGITLRDSTFDFRAVDGWAQAILISDDESGASASGLHVEDCTFIAPKQGRASMARLRGPKVENYTEAGNLWVGGVWEAPVIQNRV